MGRMIAASAVALATAVCGPARAASVGDLVARGFVLVKATGVAGNFEGCDYGLQVPLADGGVFVCNSFGYMHAHNPKALLLKSPDGHYKLLVNGVVFDGALA